MKWINGDSGRQITNLVVTEVRRIYDFTVDEDGITDWKTDYTSQDDLDVTYEYEDEDGNLCDDDTLECVDDEDDEAMRLKCDGGDR
jgi:hypothetical protein